MQDSGREVYHRLVRASLLMEEASAQATRAAAIASNLRRLLSDDATVDLREMATALDLMHTSVERSSVCTREAFTLIRVA